MTYVTPEAKAYKADCQRIAQAAGIHTPIAGRVSVGLQLYPARPQDWAKRASKDPMSWDDTVRSLDLDNARKVVYDALKEVVFEDDSRVFSDWACRMEPDAHGARVLVRVASIVRANPQASLLEAMAA